MKLVVLDGVATVEAESDLEGAAIEALSGHRVVLIRSDMPEDFSGYTEEYISAGMPGFGGGLMPTGAAPEPSA